MSPASGVAPSTMPSGSSVAHRRGQPGLSEATSTTSGSFLERTARRAGVPEYRQLAGQLTLLAEGALMTSAITSPPL